MKLSDITSLTRAFIEATRGEVVSVSEIDARARLCKNCPARVRTRGVGRVSEILGQIANKNKLPSDLKDFSCSVCGCAFQLLIPSTKPHVDSDRERARRIKLNDKCWILKL